MAQGQKTQLAGLPYNVMLIVCILNTREFHSNVQKQFQQYTLSDK